MSLRKFTSVGCYPIVYVNNKYDPLCSECAEEHSIKASFINWENADLYCDTCSVRIESAYAENN